MNNYHCVCKLCSRAKLERASPRLDARPIEDLKQAQQVRDANFKSVDARERNRPLAMVDRLKRRGGRQVISIQAARLDVHGQEAESGTHASRLQAILRNYHSNPTG